MKDVLMNLSIDTSRLQGPDTPEGQHQRGPQRQMRTVPGVASSPLRNSSSSQPFPFPISPSKTKVTAGYNVYVSPMRDPTMTPRTKTLFCVGGLGEQSNNSKPSTPKAVPMQSLPSFANWNSKMQDELVQAVAAANRMDASNPSLDKVKPEPVAMAED